MKKHTIKARMAAMFGESKNAQEAGLIRLGFSYPCWKCGHNDRPGYINAFQNVENGRCFACWGKSFKEYPGVLPAKVTRANIGEIEAAFHARRSALKKTAVLMARTSALFALDMTAKWRPCRVGHQSLFAA